MPLYEYRCLKCNRHVEKIENVNGPHLKKCPHCGGAVESVLSAPAIQFKGSGWYVTDYGGKSPAASDSKSEKSGKSEKTESKPAASTQESKKNSKEK